MVALASFVDPNSSIGDTFDGSEITRVIDAAAGKYVWSRQGGAGGTGLPSLNGYSLSLTNPANQSSGSGFLSLAPASYAESYDPKGIGSGTSITFTADMAGEYSFFVSHTAGANPNRIAIEINGTAIATSHSEDASDGDAGFAAAAIAAGDILRLRETTSNTVFGVHFLMLSHVGEKGANGRGIASTHRSDGATAIGGTVYTLNHFVIEFDDGTFQDMGLAGGDGQGIDHISRTSGDGSEGTTDTYTAWGDVGETINLGTYDVPIPAVPPPNATRTSINRAERNDAIVYPLANGVLDLGFDWQTGDFIRFYLRRTNDGAWRTVDIKAQLPSRGDFDTVDLIFASASGAQGMNVVVGGSGTAGWEIREAELWVYGDNGHYIPTGTELVTERTLTLTTPSGATTHTVYDELEWPVNAALTDPGNEFVEAGTFTAASAHATGCHGTIGSNGSLLVQPDGVDCSITLTEKVTPAPGPAVERVVYQRNRGSTMTFGDLQFRVPSSGNSSLQMRMGSGSMVISNFLTHWGHQQGGASEESISFNLTTSWRYFRTQGLNLTQHNNFQESTFEANGWLYHVGCIVGGSWQNNRFSFTRWRVESLKGDTGSAGTDGTDGTDGKGIVTAHRSDGATAIGGTVYTLDHIIYEFTDNTFQDMGFLVAPAAAGITTVELAAYDGASTTGQTLTLAGGRTWQNVLDEFQFVYVNLSGNNLFAHDQSRQWHVSDLSTQSRDMAITDYQTHGSNSYHYRLQTPAASSTGVLIDNDGSTMSVQRIKVIGVK